jgi:hypothetical protein
LGTVGYI